MINSVFDSLRVAVPSTPKKKRFFLRGEGTATRKLSLKNLSNSNLYTRLFYNIAEQGMISLIQISTENIDFCVSEPGKTLCRVSSYFASQFLSNLSLFHCLLLNRRQNNRWHKANNQDFKFCLYNESSLGVALPVCSLIMKNWFDWIAWVNPNKVKDGTDQSKLMRVSVFWIGGKTTDGHWTNKN